MNKKSILKEIHRTLNDEPWLSIFESYLYLEINNAKTRKIAANLIHTMLKILFESIFNFISVACGETNNPPKIIKRNQLVIHCRLADKENTLNFKIIFGPKLVAKVVKEKQ